MDFKHPRIFDRMDHINYILMKGKEVRSKHINIIIAHSS